MAVFGSVGPLHDCFSRARLFHYMVKPSFLKILKCREVAKNTLEGLVKKSSSHMRSQILMISFYVNQLCTAKMNSANSFLCLQNTSIADKIPLFKFTFQYELRSKVQLQ